MAEAKYEKYIVTELKKNIGLPSFRPGEVLESARPGEKRMMNHVIWMDGEVVPGYFYSECVWFFPGMTPEHLQRMSKDAGPQAHTHPFEEVITFFGTNFDDPHDLCGEVELWLEDEQFILNKSFIAYIPAGMKHRPLRIRRIDKPMFHFTLGPGRKYGGQDKVEKQNVAGLKLAKQFVFQDKPNLKLPTFRHGISKETVYRTIYLDSETVPGSKFYAEAIWFWPRPNSPKPKPGDEAGPKAHTHRFPEMIGFFGTNPDDIHDLCGEIELWIDGEQYLLTKSFVAFIPAGLVHCPLYFRRIDRPIFHFTAGPGEMYE